MKRTTILRFGALLALFQGCASVMSGSLLTASLWLLTGSAIWLTSYLRPELIARAEVAVKTLRLRHAEAKQSDH